MSVKLNQAGYDHAQALVKERKVELDERDYFSDHQASTEMQNLFLEEHGFGEYRKWFLGIDDEQPPETKRHYRFPYGDFAKIHRCAVLTAESRAGQYKHTDIELAAAHLHGMLDALK